MSVGKLTRYGLPYSNVVPTGTATNQITPGRTLELLRLHLAGGLSPSMLTMTRFKANGKTVIEASGPELMAINQYRNEGNGYMGLSFLDVQFADFTMIAETDRMVGAFDTSVGINNITTEVSISGATAPVLTPILIESATQTNSSGTPQPYAGYMSKLLRYPWNISNGGRLPFNLPFGAQNGAIIKRAHIFHNGYMTAATVKQDGLVIHESKTQENEYDQRKYGRQPQWGVYTLDFVGDGNVRKGLDTRDAKSLEWLFDFSQADNGVVLVEYLDPLGNL